MIQFFIFQMPFFFFILSYIFNIFVRKVIQNLSLKQQFLFFLIYFFTLFFLFVSGSNQEKMCDEGDDNYEMEGMKESREKKNVIISIKYNSGYIFINFNFL